MLYWPEDPKIFQAILQKYYAMADDVAGTRTLHHQNTSPGIASE